MEDAEVQMSQSVASPKVLDAVAFLVNTNVAREHRMRIPKNEATMTSTSKNRHVQAKSRNTSP